MDKIVLTKEKETLLYPLFGRAKEAAKKTPILFDKKAVEIVGHAVHAATYAAKAVTYTADPNTAKERNWQFQHLLDLGDNH